MRKALFLTLSIVTLLSVTSVTINQVIKTKLRVFVRNDLGNLVEGAEVTLYKTEEDYRNEENAVHETKKTDSKGRVQFKELETIPYFIHVEKGGLNNNSGGIQIGKLERGRLNKSTIIIN